MREIVLRVAVQLATPFSTASIALSRSGHGSRQRRGRPQRQLVNAGPLR